MSDLVTIIRAIVRDELRTLRLGDLAVVTGAFAHAQGDSHNYECNVKLRESDVELRKVPLATPHVGMVSAPRVGDLVLISYVGGDPNRPIIVGRLYSDQVAPPPHELGEWRVAALADGSTSIAIDKDQAVVIQAGETQVKLRPNDNLEIVVKKDAKIAVQGNVVLSCTDCAIEASGNIDLGKGGAGVITTESHRCYFSGEALIGSKSVKAKG